MHLPTDDSNIYRGCFHPGPWSSCVDLKITHPFPTHNHLPAQFLININRLRLGIDGSKWYVFFEKIKVFPPGVRKIRKSLEELSNLLPLEGNANKEVEIGAQEIPVHDWRLQQIGDYD